MVQCVQDAKEQPTSSRSGSSSVWRAAKLLYDAAFMSNLHRDESERRNIRGPTSAGKLQAKMEELAQQHRALVSHGLPAAQSRDRRAPERPGGGRDGEDADDGAGGIAGGTADAGVSSGAGSSSGGAGAPEAGGTGTPSAPVAVRRSRRQRSRRRGADGAGEGSDDGDHGAVGITGAGAGSSSGSGGVEAASAGVAAAAAAVCDELELQARASQPSRGGGRQGGTSRGGRGRSRRGASAGQVEPAETARQTVPAGRRESGRKRQGQPEPADAIVSGADPEPEVAELATGAGAGANLVDPPKAKKQKEGADARWRRKVTVECRPLTPDDLEIGGDVCESTVAAKTYLKAMGCTVSRGDSKSKDVMVAQLKAKLGELADSSGNWSYVAL